jgi:mRNA interferase MazF
LTGDDVILCQITSRAVSDSYVIPLVAQDFASGQLRQSSNVRPNRIFTADSNIVLYRIGTLRPPKIAEIVARIIEIISR